jgi:hypothetical protein
MSNPTSNFGWQMPTPTDLVTDLPADFEVFGQAVDSSLADLKGGTTGQVLSKNSNTDMDFVWVTDAAGDITGVTAGTGISGGGTSGNVTITNSMATEITAKGDLIVGTGSATFDNLAAGSNGNSLVADSSTATGLRYQGSQAAGKNAIINGGMDIWQRGTSSASVGYQTADRWYCQNTGSGTTTFSRESTIVPAGSTYSLKLAQTVASGGLAIVDQIIETANAIQFAGQNVTFSLLAAATSSQTVTMDLAFSTTVDAGVGGSWTGITATTTSYPTPTSSTFVKGLATFAVPSNAKSLRLRFYAASFASGNSVYVSQVQLELGSVATSFTRAGGTIQGELAACQRYYFRSTGSSYAGNSSSTNYPFFGQQLATSTTTSVGVLQLPVPMRVYPTALEFVTAGLYGLQNGTTRYACSSVALDGSTIWASPTTVGISTSTSSLTTNNYYYLVGNFSSTAYIGVSAEL